MNIIHHTSKNANYYDILDYYTLVHREDPLTGHYEPVLDENGMRQPRQNCRTIYINAFGQDDDPEHFARDCFRTNRKYGKNNMRADVKTHEYILSHDVADRPYMTDDDLEQEARAWTDRYGKGYQVLISIHRDTDNDHIHITINSVRDGAREPQEWMKHGSDGQVLPCEVAPGGKHQQSTALRCDMNEWALARAQEHGLLAEDNNLRAKLHTEARYSERNAYLRNAALDCARRANRPLEFKQLLKEEYGIDFIVRGRTVSLKHPDAEKATRLRSLDLTDDDLLCQFHVLPENAANHYDRQVADAWRQYEIANEGFWAQRRLVGQSLREDTRRLYDCIHADFEALKEARRVEGKLNRWNTGFFERLIALNQFRHTADPNKLLARIAQTKEKINENKVKRVKLDRAAELQKVYAATARAALSLHDLALYEETMEWMTLMRVRLTYDSALFTDSEYAEACQKLWEVYGRLRGQNSNTGKVVSGSGGRENTYSR